MVINVERMRTCFSYAVVSQCRRGLGLVATHGRTCWRAKIHLTFLLYPRSRQGRRLGQLLTLRAYHFESVMLC